MTMPNVFDFGRLLEEAKAGAAWPEADYSFEVTEANSGQSQGASPNPQVAVKLRCLEGPQGFVNKILTLRFTLVADAPGLLAMFFRHMAGFGLDDAFFRALGQQHDLTPVARQLPGRRVRIHLTRSERNGGVFNNPASIQLLTGAMGPAGGVMPGMPPGMMPQPGMPPGLPMQPPGMPMQPPMQQPQQPWQGQPAQPAWQPQPQQPPPTATPAPTYGAPGWEQPQQPNYGQMMPPPPTPPTGYEQPMQQPPMPPPPPQQPQMPPQYGEQPQQYAPNGAQPQAPAGWDPATWASMPDPAKQQILAMQGPTGGVPGQPI